MEFYSSQGPSLFPSIFHITDIKLTYFPWGADGWDCWQNVEQKAGKKNSQDGSCTKCNRKRSREGRWDHPQHGAVNSFALMSIPGSETKEWCHRWCDGTGLGLKHLFCQKGLQSESLGQLECPGCTDSDSGTASRGSHPEEMLPPKYGWAALRAKQSQPGIWAGYGSARWHSLKLTHSHL